MCAASGEPVHAAAEAGTPGRPALVFGFSELSWALGLWASGLGFSVSVLGFQYLRVSGGVGRQPGL